MVERLLLGNLSKPRRRRQRERRQIKGLMSKTIAVHVRYKSLYISLPSSPKQQREMTKFCIVYGTWTTKANFSFFHSKLNAVVAYLARLLFKAFGVPNRSKQLRFIFYLASSSAWSLLKLPILAIRHFRVLLWFFFKTSLSAKHFHVKMLY